MEKIGEVITAEKGDLTIKMAVSLLLCPSSRTPASEMRERRGDTGPGPGPHCEDRIDANIPASQKSFPKRTMRNSKPSWINSKRQTWMSQVMMIRMRRKSRPPSPRAVGEGEDEAGHRVIWVATTWDHTYVWRLIRFSQSGLHAYNLYIDPKTAIFALSNHQDHGKGQFPLVCRWKKWG